MRRFLPIFIAFSLFTVVYLFSAKQVAAADTSASSSGSIEGKWVPDQEVTFVGKMATRSDDFLNWTLQNYDWLCVKRTSDGKCDNNNNPLVEFWKLVRNVIYALLVLFVLATAFVMIITRGQNITVMRFIPRFVLIVVLVTLSFSLIEALYSVSDVIQGFLFRINVDSVTRLIGSQDLLHIAFDYNHFEGFRRIGPGADESAFISLLLVRLTAFTYYTMTGILLVRKIILWFFIIVSPVFPLLLFYAPIRNTAKIWIGEYFRWLLYAPLFALFLHGLVVMWRSPTGIPLPFPQIDQGLQNQACTQDASFSCYPTAVNILLGGPGQAIGLSNSVNLRDTFALYVVALLMLWVVILLPFVLLNIFLDYLGTISFRENTVLKQLYARSLGFINPRGVGPSPTSPSPPPTPAATGVARALPFFNKAAISTSDLRTIQTTNLASVQSATEIMKLTNLSVPKMRDIARYESSLLAKDVSRTQEVSHVNSTLQKIANPHLVTNPIERQQFSTLREKLIQQKQKGDPLAGSILSASNVVSSTKITQTGQVPLSSQTATKIQEFAKESGKMGVAKVGAPTAPVNLPVVNRVQQVSIEDYEEVKKMWKENYANLEPPKNINGTEMNRQEWVKSDMEKINQAITLLTSVEPQKVNEGMQMVANILPFLLIGGFSKTEVIAYLKAKLEAAKDTLSESAKKEEEEETMLSREEKKSEGKKEMTMEAKEELPTEEQKTEAGENPYLNEKAENKGNVNTFSKDTPDKDESEKQ